MVSESAQLTAAFQTSQDKVALQHAVAMLGPDWQLLNPTASSPATATALGPHMPAILANPAWGIILLDIAPHISSDAIERFRNMLERIGFAGTCPGNLPIVHRVLPYEHLRRLPDIVDYAFSWESPLAIRPDVPWVTILRERLTAVPNAEASLGSAGARRRARSDMHEVAGVAPPPLPSALLLVACGLLIAIGGGTAMMWRRLVTEPVTSQLTMNAGDDAHAIMPGTEGGGSWKVSDLPVPRQVSEELNILNNETIGNPQAILTTQDPDRANVADPREQNDTASTAAGTTSVLLPSLSEDAHVGTAPTIEQQREPFFGEDVPNVTSPRSEEPAVIAEASPTPDGSTVLEPSLMPGNSAAGDGSSSTKNETESAVILNELAETPSQTIPDQHQNADSQVTMTAPAEQRTGIGPAGSSSPSKSSDALLSNLLRRGDNMLALGDVSAARLFYERAATAGSGKAATALGKTYDPEVLARLGAPGSAGDAKSAVRWYRTAQHLGDPEAARLLNKAEQLRP